MKGRVVLSIVILLLAGCATVAPAPPRQINISTAFDQSEVQWFKTKGNGSITGQAYFQTVGGQPRTCAGGRVTLYPHSTYIDKLTVAVFGNTTSGYVPIYQMNFQVNPRSPSATSEYAMTAACDAQGNFSFTDLPAGSYYVLAGVVWTIPGENMMPPQGGELMRSVTLGAGESKRVILTP